MNNKLSFAIVTLLFFLWGFITCMNDILIPYVKSAFQLSYAKAMLVQFAFFMAYFVGSLVYFVVSAFAGDPINKIGYKAGIVAGLVTASVGLALFYPAAKIQSYGFFLTALFVLGLGFTLLQIAANPYVAILGPPKTASARLNLAQGFNSFGTTIAPLIGGYLIFQMFGGQSNVGAEAVKTPYLFFSVVTLSIALFFSIVKLPAFTNTEKVDQAAKAFQFPQLSFGIIAIFMYVGGEVAMGSMLTSYVGLKEVANLPPIKASMYVALYWGGLMIGRFTGSAVLGNFSNIRKAIMAFSVPIVISTLLSGIFYIKGTNIKELIYYIPFIFILGLGFVVAKFKPARTLMTFAIINVALSLISITTNGKTALFSVIAAGLFNSIMWGNIFTLAIYNLGKYTSQGSALLVMGILGAAIIPIIQGAIADHIGVHLSYLVPIFCFGYVAWYAWMQRNLIAEI